MKKKEQNQKQDTLSLPNNNNENKQLALREIFTQKILNLQILREAKSSQDLVKKQHRLQLSKKMGHKDKESLTNSNDSIQFHKEIQRIKQRLLEKLKEQEKVDLARHKDLKSRQVFSKKDVQNYQSIRQQLNRKISKNKHLQQGSTSLSQSEKFKQLVDVNLSSPSYNYFNYGQRIPFIQGRHIQFKHFKDISDPHHIPLIMRYITAFLNSQGGKLLIGIDDSSYVYGAKFSQYQYDKFLLNIDKQGKFGMNPPLMPQKYQIRRIPVNHQKRGQQRWVIQIKVHPDLTKPKKINTYNRRCYMRMNASNHELDASDLLQYLRLNNEDNSKYQQQKDSQGQENKKKQQQKSTTVTELSLTNNNNKGQQKRQKQKQRQKQRGQIFVFEQSYLNKLPLNQLQSLKKQYEQRYKKICQVYSRKQRQTR